MEIREHIQRQYGEGIDMAKKVRDVTNERPVLDVEEVKKDMTSEMFSKAIDRMDSMITELRQISTDLHKLRESLT